MSVSLTNRNASSLIDDVSIDDDEDKGHPILFNNQEIRQMLDLARVGSADIFYDLGSGWGQNLIIAITEFHVKRAVGIEKDRERHDVCVERLQTWKIPSSRGTVLLEDFDKLLAGRVKGANLGEATVVFYGLSTGRLIIDRLRRHLKRASRLIYYYNCLFPEIMPDRVEFPFYMSVAPFRRPRSQSEWLSAIIRKKKSSVAPGKRPGLDELWYELAHDYDVNRIRDRIDDYENRLKKTLGSS